MTELGSTRAAGSFALAAGFIHAIAAGTHVEHKVAALSMAALAAGQCASGLALLTSRSTSWKRALVVVNLLAIAGWLATRTVGIGFIDGFDSAESIQTADTLCALLATLAIVAVTPRVNLSRIGLTETIAPVVAIILAVPAIYSTANHQHDHGSAEWPRPYFPSIGIDIEDVPGVSAEQEERARQLVLDTQRDLVRWADYNVAVAEGWRSIGDEATGYEHFVNFRYFDDGNLLDSNKPESIVYKVYGDKRILVSAMYMAEGEPDLDAAELTEFAGPLFQWHVHTDLCWTIRNGRPAVAGVTNENGSCPPGSIAGLVKKPMVHVWIVPHPCGPFAAVEGLAEGQAAVDDSERVDICGSHSH
jgi:hypothetical protein